MKVLLLPLSFLFKSISALHLFIKQLNRKKFKKIFIISSESISFGGTGKTPLTIFITETLIACGIKTAIITRGYKSESEHSNHKAFSEDSADKIGDEAKIYTERFKNKSAVYVGKNRSESIAMAISDGAEVAVMDDGFSCTDICKDIRILLYNPEHDWTFLRAFKFMVKSHTFRFSYKRHSVSPEIKDTYWFKKKGFYYPDNKPAESTDFTFTGFSGLGDNRRFRADLSAFKLKSFTGFKDHHKYSEQDINELEKRRITENADYLVTTEKDFMRVPENLKSKLPFLIYKNSIEFSIDLKEEIIRYVKGK